MKKIVLLITLIFFSYIVTYAETGNTIHSQISKQIKMPAELKNEKLNETVKVEFTILENGSVTVLNVETHKPELKQYIISQFSTLDLKGVTIKKNEIYLIDINFKVL
ncbi:MAG: hypothetical protein K0Q95_492 [Bacteroidota bacterium]|jgi:hypothetical protein|nr:hypothetical protein [Bacteroidota bacterium]